MTLSQDAISEVFKQESDVVFHTLLTIDHPSFSQAIRLVDNGEDIWSRGLPFIAVPFQLSLPTLAGDSPPEVQIVVDNVDRQILGHLRSDVTAADITIEIVRSDALDTVEVEIPDLKLRVTEYDALKITGSVAPDYPISQGFIGERYTPATTPGLFIVR